MNNKLCDKTKLMIGVSSIILFSCGFLGYVVASNEEKKMEQALNNGMYFSFVHDGDETIEYGSTIDPESFVDKYSGDLKIPTLNTKTVGTQKLIYTLNFGDFTKQFEKKVKIQDTKKPTIKALKGNRFVVKKGDVLPYKEKDFECIDPVDGKLKPRFKGIVNLNSIGTYTVQVSCEDLNGNRCEETITVQVVEPKPSEKLSYDIGEKLDSYLRVDKNTIEVRNRLVHVDEDIEDEELLHTVQQMNLCPNFLLASVDSFSLLNESNFAKYVPSTTEKKEKIMGHHHYSEKKSNIYLLAQKDDDLVLLHECIHAFSYKHKIAQNKEFLKIFKLERDNFNESASENAEEFFAYTFTEYLTKGYDKLFEYCPQAAQYYKEMKL